MAREGPLTGYRFKKKMSYSKDDIECAEILDSYETDESGEAWENLIEKFENASIGVLTGKFGLFHYLTEADNGLPQTIRTNYKYRSKLLILIVNKLTQ